MKYFILINSLIKINYNVGQTSQSNNKLRFLIEIENSFKTLKLTLSLFWFSKLKLFTGKVFVHQ